MSNQVPLHTLLVLVDRIVRVPLSPKPHSLSVRKNSHKLVGSIARLEELYSHRMLILIEI